MKVSICCLTYNHEKLVGQAIDSFIMQQTSFDFEIVIGEDCSVDNTRAVLLEYQSKYPQKIKLLLNEKNIGVFENLNKTLQACAGEYIAICDGDDYWIDPLKLEKQVEFLDQNSDCSLCYTNYYTVKNDDRELGDLVINTPRPPKHSFKWMLDHFAIAAPSTWLFRSNGLPSPLPEWMKPIYNMDIAMEGLLSLHGNFGYLNFPGAVYRDHPGGITNVVKDSMYKSKNLLYLINNLSPLLGRQYRKSIDLHRADHLEYLAFENLKQKKFSLFFSGLLHSFSFQYAKPYQSWRTTGYRFREAIRIGFFNKKN